MGDVGIGVKIIKKNHIIEIGSESMDWNQMAHGFCELSNDPFRSIKDRQKYFCHLVLKMKETCLC